MGLLGAIQFLTRIPLKLPRPIEHARAVPWFPIVGVLIGAAVGGAAAGLAELVPTAVGAACAIVLGLLITGAFHEDGLADISDAFGGGATRERRLEILKDPRHGTYGVAALTASVVLRVVSAGSISSQAALLAGFVAAHTLGRTAAVATMLLSSAIPNEGLGADHTRRLRPVPTVFGAAAGVAVTVAVTGWWAVPLVVVAAVGTVATVRLAMRKVGEINGDTLGAIEQVTECLVLVTITGLAARHAVWWS